MGKKISIYERFPNSGFQMKYHDRNKCVSVQAIDKWQMPALNALVFRAIYVADDSGETANFMYVLKKDDEGQWKLERFDSEGYFRL